MYRCRQCNEIQNDPVIKKDLCDGEAYRFCRYCGGNVDKPEANCRLCGKELFPQQRAYEIGPEIYCAECVSEIII